MRVALIEFNNYHTECLYSQALFLKNEGCQVTLIISPKAKNIVGDFSKLTDKVYYYDKKIRFNIFKNAFNLLKLIYFLYTKDFDKIIFNTASSSKTIILLSLILKPKKTELIGTLHNLKKIKTSLSQKIIINNLHKFFVLNDFLLQELSNQNLNLKVSSFYPIFFPGHNQTGIKKPKDEIWICIPGEVNYRRRDYDIILKSLQKIRIDEKLKFIILGKLMESSDSQNFINQIFENNLENLFVTFNEYIDNPLFFSYLSESDFLLANLQIKDDSYLKYKISGIINLALGFKKNIITNKKLSFIEDLNNNSFFYENENDLAILLSNILSVVQQNEKYKTSNKLTLHFQQKKYISFIKNNR